MFGGKSIYEVKCKKPAKFTKKIIFNLKILLDIKELCLKYSNNMGYLFFIVYAIPVLVVH